MKRVVELWRAHDYLGALGRVVWIAVKNPRTTVVGVVTIVAGVTQLAHGFSDHSELENGLGKVLVGLGFLFTLDATEGRTEGPKDGE